MKLDEKIKGKLRKNEGKRINEKERKKEKEHKRVIPKAKAQEKE